MNIVLLVKDRPTLTKQCLTTLLQYTDEPFNVTVIDDESKPETEFMLRMFARDKHVAVLRNQKSRGITGQVRNLGVYWAKAYWGAGRFDYLYLSDNDAAFTPHWNTKLLAAWEWASLTSPPVKLLGGQNHPYHQPLDVLRKDDTEVRIYGAVAGTSQLMQWMTWEEYGPLDANAPGVCQSEDHAFCQRIRNDGYNVGAIWPPVVLDCGIHQTDGSLSVGHEAKQKVNGLIYE